MSEKVDRLLATAREAASVAARIHREAAQRGDGGWIDEKTTSSDFVSDVDMAAQEAAMSVIEAQHPEHAILAEEEGGGRDGATDNNYLWLVDPLDGTTNFLHGHPYHAASVAVWDGEGPLAAAVEAQALGKVWTAARGRGAFENGVRIRVSRTAEDGSLPVGYRFPLQEPRAAARIPGRARPCFAPHCRGSPDRGRGDRPGLCGQWHWTGSGSRLAPCDYARGCCCAAEAGGVVERVEGGGQSG